MIQRIYFAFIFTGISICGVHAQVTGMWKTIDDRDGSEKSVIEIFEQDGKLSGKVVRLLAGATYTTCENCEGELKDKPIVGMTILSDLTKTATFLNISRSDSPRTGKKGIGGIELSKR